jgi:ABC-2 type transport system permease protein
MGLDRARYHGWHGELGSSWRSCLTLVRVGLVQVFRRKLYWGVLVLGLMQFLWYFSAIYSVTLSLPPETQDWVLENFGFHPRADQTQESGYTRFMERQSLVVMILLAFSGSLLVGADFRHKSLPFYLSRRIDRRHYIVGKLLAVSTIVSLLTTLPALVLFVEYGMFTGSTDYWVEHWRIPLAVLVYGAVLCVVLSILLVTLSAYLERLAPIAVTWASLFLLLSRLSAMLREVDPGWQLLDPWHDIHEVGRMLFVIPADADQQRLAWWALAILVAVCGVCLAALVRRVRAVEIVH